MGVALVLWSTPASAQTGMIKGKVLDAKSQPVEAARVVVEFLDGVNRRFETKTNSRGEFIQIGLVSGNYRVTADKDGVSQSFEANVRVGQTAEINFQLVPGQGGGGPMTKEEAAKGAAFKSSIDLAVAANQAGNYDEAIAKFTEALALRPDCPNCYVNIGYAYVKKKEYDKAEASYKKALELKPDSAEAYSDLANLYNLQKKFDLATAASDQAAKLSTSAGAAGGAGSPDIVYNQGVILWNAGTIAEARKAFEEVLKLNPNHADAHYQIGMANLNEGRMQEAVTSFEMYLKLAPDGPFAAQAKGVLSQIKK
jgi:tetratricopeptide (TPR) repeat protein